MTIEAMQWDGTIAGGRPIHDWITEHGGTSRWSNDNPVQLLAIETLEGTMKASPTDWIIKGTEGEFYPCKDSVFQRKYASDADLEPDKAEYCEEAVQESSILLTRHPYAHNSYYLEHFTGVLLLGNEDLRELYNQLDQHLYPNPGHETALPVSTRRG